MGQGVQATGSNGGDPVKQVRALTDKENAFFTYSAANYVKLKDLHLAEGYDTL